MRRIHIALLIAGALSLDGCARSLRQTPDLQGQRVTTAELWQAPVNLERRDLFHGVGGSELAPRGDAFEFVARDTSGFSPGFDVKDRSGLEWSVKSDPEAQSEVVSSRVLWAIGFHQPPTYYLPAWNLTGAEAGPQDPGRFRPKLPAQKVVGDWSWYENPFIGSQPFGGLIVANLILNSWDWKTSNNKIYEVSEPGGGVARWFVVRDLGASLGKTTYPHVLKWFRLRGFGQGTRSDLPGFESQGFIKGMDGESGVDFDYRGIYRDVIDSVTPAHVRWACDLLARLSDAQWRDAFRAGGYDKDQSERFIAKIKDKIQQGRRLTSLSKEAL